MPERCMRCRKQITKYVILGVTEFQDTGEDSEGTKCDDAVLCVDCWSHIKESLKILQVILPRL